MRGVVGAGAGDHGALAADLVDHGLPQVQLLGVGERRRLAGGAGDDEAVVAVVDQAAGQPRAASRSRPPSSSKGVTIAVTMRPKGARPGAGFRSTSQIIVAATATNRAAARMLCRAMATARGMERARPPELPPRTRRDGPRRCLVTGGAGFIGAYVLQALLASGREVCAYDVAELAPEGRFVLGARAADARVERGSVDDEARLFDVVAAYDPDEIVHLATVIDPAFLVRHRSAALRINVGGTINVLEAMRLFGVERLVNISSIGVLPPVQYEPVDARHPVLLPEAGPGTDFYGAAKVASEAFCFAYRGALGIDFRTVRPSAVYGLGMNRFPGPIKDMVEATVHGERLRLPTGGPHPRDFTHAADVAGLIVALLGAPDDADRIFYGATAGRWSPAPSSRGSWPRCCPARTSRSATSSARPSAAWSRCADGCRSRTPARSSAGSRATATCATASRRTRRSTGPSSPPAAPEPPAAQAAASACSR